MAFSTLRAVAKRAVEDQTVPGLVVAVGQGGKRRFCEAFGDQNRPPSGPPAAATVETVYDLASLTKALCTSILAMRAVVVGQLDLHAPLFGQATPFTDARWKAVSAWHLLSHSSGLPAHRPFHQAGDRNAVIRAAAHEPFTAAPAQRSVYSDLGFILLGALLEERMGARLDWLFDRFVLSPFQITDVAFSPHAAALGTSPIAPTELCPQRGHLICGDVHDLNAFAMDGVAGHAGLFGAAAGLCRLVETLLAAYRGASVVAGTPPLVQREVLREFWSPAGVPGSTWRLGWDGPSANGSLAGDLISRAAVGHLGFTGCAVWIDPERELFVLQLSNRVHPQVVDDPRFRILRRALNDSALSDLVSEG